MKGQLRMKNRMIFVGIAVMALVTPCWPLALTTFGKSNPQQNQNQNENKQNGERVQARECLSDAECRGIKGASCLESIFASDNKQRCLCGDYREPKNGLCDNKYNGVKVRCNGNDECTPGAHCMIGNDTTLTGTRCWCMQGYIIDEDMQCSGSPSAFGFTALTLVASLILAGNV